MPDSPSSPPPAASQVPLPDFLVIGAMKCGTTTLYHDLRNQPGICLPDKESNALLSDDPSRSLQQLFPAAASPTGPVKLLGEICPDYTKPGFDQQASTAAARLFGEKSPALIYIVREPVARLLSHHRFVSTQFGEANPGGMTGDLEKSLRDFPELIATSSYAQRLHPWLDQFGSERLMIVRFEDYVTERSATVERIAEQLGGENSQPSLIAADRVHNSGTDRPVATPGWRRLLRNPLYRRVLRPFLPLERRDQLRRLLLPKPPPPPPPPSAAIIESLIDTLRPEVDKLSLLAGRSADDPLWDLEKVRQSFTDAPVNP